MFLECVAVAEPIQFRATLVAPEDVERFEATVIVERRDLATAEPQILQFDVLVPGLTELKIDDVAGQWKIRLHSEDYWSEEKQFTPSADELLELRVFATATLLFELVDENGGGLPETVQLDFSNSPKYVRPSGREVPSASMTCGAAGEHFSCQVPAGELDLRLEAANAAPIYLWGLGIKAGETRKLGRFSLVQGGSVAGFVSDDDGRPVDGAEVVLAIPVAPTGAPNPVIQSRLDRLSRRTTTNTRGFFQLAGLTPGAYTVSATRRGFASAEISTPLLIRGDLEERLNNPLVLTEPNSLEIAIQPSVDPKGEPWRVRVFSVEGRSGLEFSGKTSETGIWSHRGIEPGAYLLVVKAADGARWFAEQLTLGSGEQSRAYDIPVLRVNGSVSMGTSAVSGRLELILRDKGSQIDFDTDEEGKFQGYLPYEGLWAVQFEMQKPASARLALDPIEIEKRSDGRPVELDVEIPDTRLEGEVVDSEGRPVHGARVHLIHLDLLPNSDTRTDSSGSFELIGLKPGSIQVFARKGREQSEIRVVEIQEDLTPPRLRLELLEPVEFHGQVLNAYRQPLPGASISAWLEGGSSPLRQVKRATTDVDGSFVLEVPGASSLSLFVQAPGYASRILDRSVELPEPVLVILEPGGGSLILDFSAQTEEARYELLKSVSIAHENASIPLLSLLGHLGRNIRESLSLPQLEIPALASGTYAICGLLPPGFGSPRGTLFQDTCETTLLNPNGIAKVAVLGHDEFELPQD